MNTNDFTTEAIDKVKSNFDLGETIILGCTVNVTRKNEPVHYEDKNGNMAVRSSRYWGAITFPDGTRKDFKNARGGAISRDCGFWSRKERDDRNKQGDLHEITNRRTMED